MRRLVCALLGHRWDRSLDDIAASAWFARVDCTRCGLAIDAAPLRRLRPEARKRLGLP